MPGEKPAEASLDWKPNGHTVPGLGIEPRLSGPQRGGSTVTLPASPCFCTKQTMNVSICAVERVMVIDQKILQIVNVYE